MSGTLEIRGVTVSYGERPALRLDSCRIEPNRIVAVVGENGSGKSTLLKAIARLVKLSSGDITFSGRRMNDLTRRETARLAAFAPQSAELVFPIAVLDLVLQGRSPWRRGFLWESRGDLEIARSAMRSCDIEHLADRDATRLSGGERRRVFLARVLAQETPLWLLDEPTADLDPRHRLEFLEVLASVHRDRATSVLWATHDLNEALSLAHDLLLLREGRLVAFGPVAECLTSETLEKTFRVGAKLRMEDDGRPRVTFFR